MDPSPSDVGEIPPIPVADEHSEKLSFLVKRLFGWQKHYMSLHSLSINPLRSAQTSRFIELAFFDSPPVYEKDDYDDYSCSSECRGLFCFDNLNGNIVICNLRRDSLMLLPSPHIERYPHITLFEGTGFGYDRTTRDYKIVRMFRHNYYDDEGEDEIGRKRVAEVYAFKEKCWKEIARPRATINYAAAYVDGNYYWEACFFSIGRAILSFNFATEIFSSLSFPTSEIHNRDYGHVLVDLDNKLGVIIYARPRASMIEIWVLEEGSWVKYFTAPFDNVVKPLGLINKVLFLEGKSSSELSQLLVYSLATGELHPLDVFDYQGMMKIFPLNKSSYRLPDAMTMSGTHIDAFEYDDPRWCPNKNEDLDD